MIYIIVSNQSVVKVRLSTNVITCRSFINFEFSSSAEADREDVAPAKSVDPEAFKPNQKCLIVTDKFRTVEKVVTSSNLAEFLKKGIISLTIQAKIIWELREEFPQP